MAVILSGNYSFVSTTGTITNATTTEWSSVNVTYTYIQPTTEEKAATGLQGNLTSGIQNVATKIPTILLIAAVVLLFGVLAILVMQAKKNGIIGGTSGATL